MKQTILTLLTAASVAITCVAAQPELDNGTLTIRTDNTYGGSIVLLSTSAGTLQFKKSGF